MTDPQSLIEVGHLRLMDAIARAGTVTRAAGELGVTQPAVSHRLRELEGRLGLTLFRRTGRRMTPTVEGRQLLASARTVLAELDRVGQELTEHRTGHRGTLRVATECYLCYGWLPGVFSKLRAAMPNVDLKIVPEATRDPLAGLLDRTLDLAIVFSAPADPRIVAHELFRDELVAVVPEAHPLARKAYLTARDFASETRICHFASRPDPFEIEVLEPAGVTPPGVLEVQVTAAVLEMVRAGMGIAVIARWAVADPSVLHKLQVRPITKQRLFRTWSAALLREHDGKPAMAMFVKLLSEQVSPVRRIGQKLRGDH